MQALDLYNKRFLDTSHDDVNVQFDTANCSDSKFAGFNMTQRNIRNFF